MKLIEQPKKGAQKRTKEKTIIENLEALFEKYVFTTLEYLRKNCKYIVPTAKISSVICLCKALESVLTGTEEIRTLEFLMNFSCVWAFGGPLAEKDAIDYRKQFSDFWKHAFKGPCKFPHIGTVFDIFIKFEDESVSVANWEVPEIEFNSQL